VAGFEIVGLSFEIQLEWLTRQGIRYQKIRRLCIDDVGKRAEARAASDVVHPPVSHHRARLNVERSDTRINRPASSRDAARVRDVPVHELLVDARIEFRLARTLIPIRRAERALGIHRICRPSDGGAARRVARVRDDWDAPDWTRECR
jgi:hypothetical protein